MPLTTMELYMLQQRIEIVKIHYIVYCILETSCTKIFKKPAFRVSRALTPTLFQKCSSDHVYRHFIQIL